MRTSVVRSVEGSTAAHLSDHRVINRNKSITDLIFSHGSKRSCNVCCIFKCSLQLPRNFSTCILIRHIEFLLAMKLVFAVLLYL